jgi:hypothetical protein
MEKLIFTKISLPVMEILTLKNRVLDRTERNGASAMSTFVWRQCNRWDQVVGSNLEYLET